MWQQWNSVGGAVGGTEKQCSWNSGTEIVEQCGGTVEQ